MRHGSLFSGIGGFDLASNYMGWTNVFHCEWNEFAQKILKYYWPKSISYADICSTDFTIHRGDIDIITGGFPCQPFSTAGKRKGTGDSRYLWPEMLRVIREVRPKWVVGENVYGLVNWDGGLVFDTVCADLENEGFQVIPIVLPSASINAPHKRDRIFFVAHSKSTGTGSDIGGIRSMFDGRGQWTENESSSSEFETIKNALRSGRSFGETIEEGTNIREQRDISPRGSERIHLSKGDITDPDGIRLEHGKVEGKMGGGQGEICGEGDKPSNGPQANGKIEYASDTTSQRLCFDGSTEQFQSSSFRAQHGVDESNVTDTNFNGHTPSGESQETEGNWGGDHGKQEEWGEQTERIDGLSGFQWDTSNANINGLQGGVQPRCDGEQGWDRQSESIAQHICSRWGGLETKRWHDFPTQPPVCGGNDGIPRQLDGITFSKWRQESLKGLGNAVVSQLVYQIFKTIDLFEKIKFNQSQSHGE